MKRKPVVHELKTWTEFYDDILSGFKTFDVRKNDRDFQIGDIVCFMDWDKEKDEYLGSKTRYKISYILYGGQFGIEQGYCVLGII